MWRGNPYHCSHDSYSGKRFISCIYPGDTEYPEDAFVIPDGAPGALAELERRKFTTEEGVSLIFCVTKVIFQLIHSLDRTTLPC